MICVLIFCQQTDPNSQIPLEGDASDDEASRLKRSFGKFRGQTQSQYLNFGDNAKDGKAEAQATHDSSRASVGT